MSQQQKIILKLLRPQQQKARMYGSWLALCIGMLLLFTALLAWFNFSEILSAKGKDTMAAYLVIGKKVTNETMLRGAGANLFSGAEVNELEQKKGVREVGVLAANNFPVSANMGGHLGFYTELFLGALDDKYLDVLPEDWGWREGQPTLPVIMSSDFLNMYNYGFALSQGLPQLSQSSIQALPIEINVARGEEKYRAQIVGFTDRIGSILVPQSFMQAMNEKYAGNQKPQASRLVIKIDDPSANEFVKFLKTKNYTTNEEQLRWNRVRSIVQAIVSSVGGIAVIVVAMAILAFILFIEVTVQRASGHIRLMKQIGYAPAVLTRVINRFFIPWISSALVIAALIAIGIQLMMRQWLAGIELQIGFQSLWILVAALVAIFLLLWALLRSASARVLARV